MMTNRRKGFSLVELLVAMAIFSVVISIATGAFIRTLRTQHQLVGFAAANSSISLVLEQMAREIRVGSAFSTTGPNDLTFKNARGETVTYAMGDKVITRNGVPLTSGNAEVSNLVFQLQYGDPADAYPARVTIYAAIAPKELGTRQSNVYVQTTVSARNIGT